MREALLFCFNLKKSAAESHRMFVEAYGDNALSETTCRDWFRRFNDDNFNLSETKKRENRPRKVENCPLQALLNEDDTQSQKMLAEQLGVSQAISIRLHAMGKVQKIGKWMPHELNDRQMEWRQNTCQILLARQKRKSFLYRIVTGDEKVDLFPESYTQEILGWSRSTINIFKIKSFRTKDDVVRLVGSGGCHLLRAVKTWCNC